MGQHPRGDEQRRLQRTRGVQKMLQVGAAVQAHAHERRFPHRPRERGQMASELSSIKRRRMDRSAFLGAAGMIGMIVGIVLAEGEFDLGIRLEEARPSRRLCRETRRPALRRSGFRLRAGCRSSLIEPVLTPARDASEFPGTQSHPPDRAVVPPNSGPSPQQGRRRPNGGP